MKENRFVLTRGTSNERAVFQFGLLLNSFIVEAWQAETIRLLIEEGHQLKLVVYNASTPQKQGIIQKIQFYPYSRFFFRFWNRFFFKPSAKRSVDISELIKKATKIYCTTSAKGHANYFNDADVSKISSLQLDFLLRFGFNIIKGDVLNVSRFGIWSFHHDDEMKYRGGPPGFWEFMKREPQNGVILQRLTNQLDKGIVLRKHWFPVIYHSYTAHLNQLYFESCIMPLQQCRSLQFGQTHEKLSHTRAKIYHPPGNIMMFLFMMKSIYRRLAFHLNDLMRQEDWHIGYGKYEMDRFQPTEKDFHKIKRKTIGTYLADPFVINYYDETFLFAEEFSYKTGKGKIVVGKKSEEYTKFKNILQNQFHFSFPFVFEFNSEIFIVPECFESNEINIFKFDSILLTATYQKTLLKGYAAVDPVVFRHEDKWWLFFTIKSMPSVHLYAFYADELFGDYQPHKNNPIKSDIGSARNAGAVFTMGSRIFRPGQDCSAHYGRAVQLCEITALTPELFEEVTVDRIDPIYGSKYPMGIHTFNKTENLYVIDGKRFIFSWYGFLHQLRRKISSVV